MQRLLCRRYHGLLYTSRTLVRNLADALSKADEESVEDLLDDARLDIQDLPEDVYKRQVLRRGGITAGGRNRIYEYFMEHHDMKDAAEFLKNEYGTCLLYTSRSQ